MRDVDTIVKELSSDPATLMRRYAVEPGLFCEDILRIEPQEWQLEWMNAVALARAGKPNDGEKRKMRFAIKSGTGVGKTSGMACLILWHLAVFPDSKIPCTAPTSPQIKAVLWPEMRKWVLNIPDKLKPYFPFEVQTDTVKFYENTAYARTAREESPEAFQGFHSKHIMLVADEASGVPDPIFLAGQGVMSSKGAITILIGNPTRPVGWFYDAFHQDAHLYWTRTVSCASSVRVQPSYVEEMRDKHGEDSYEYRVRVLGEFHLESSGTIIPRPWIDAAIGRDIVSDTDYIIWGIDVSAGLRDKSAIAKRRGNELLEPVKSWGGKDPKQFVDITLDEYYNAPLTMRPQEICVDVIGVGYGYVAMLKSELAQEIDAKRLRITAVNVAERRSSKDRYVSLRVELWGRAREWFESQVVKFPRDEVTMRQLCSVFWETHPSNGKWFIPDKSVEGKSPDEAEAFILTFAGRRGMKLHIGNNKKTVLQNRFAKTGKEMYSISSASYLQE